MKFPFNTNKSCFIFTEPYIDERNNMDYCVLNRFDVKDWYKEFMIEKYYILSFLIND